jgi:hypothetical protein
LAYGFRDFHLLSLVLLILGWYEAEHHGTESMYQRDCSSWGR